MKKLLAFLLALCMVFVTAAALAETEITVSGTGEVLQNADNAVITLGAEITGQDVQDAQSQVNTTVAAIRQALISAGIDEKCINTDSISVYPVYDFTDTQETIGAYRVSSSLAIRTKDMDRVGEIIDIAFAKGANTLLGISFGAEDTSAESAEALTIAVTDARAKAEIMAAAAGLKITGIKTMSENYSYASNSGLDHFALKASAE